MGVKPNRLSEEKSPYLLQHAENPVDWYPWCEEAFAKAAAENKPVFLSVGYSTCHWCHVMAKESFENQKVADLLNRWFVSIKVDREERPDIDHFYMTATQLLTGGGGWPMSVFLFPDKRPFYAGTYFPLQGGGGRPGFSEILIAVHRFWRENGQDLQNTAARIMKALEASGRGGASLLADDKAARLCYQRVMEEFDEKHGGFGYAPKFPQSVILNFLFRYWRNHDEKPALRAALNTLRAMAGGGMYDHLGGGFHRYSVDSQWRVPHFEKMLYDQAQLAYSYLSARQITGDEWFGSIAAEIFRYVLRDMRDPGGGFYSAEDADSPDPYAEGKHSEGGYYLWTEAEIIKTLGKGRANIFCRSYGVEAGGNVALDSTGELDGKNILYQARFPREVASHIGLDVQEVERLLAESRQFLFEKRCERERPHLDDKVIVSWNGLLIGALARGAVILNNPQLKRAAIGAAEFIRRNMYDAGEATLMRRYWRGSVGLAGLLEDYAFLISGLLELYEVSAEPAWLQWAVKLTQTQIKLFWDEQGRGFFETVQEDSRLPARLKNIHDGAVPSGNSVAVMNLLRLSELTGNEAWKKKAGQTLEAFSEQLNNYPATLVQMLCALDRFLSPPSRVVIAGPAGDEGVQKLMAVLYQNFDPDRVVFLADQGVNQLVLAESFPVIGEFKMVDDKATAYVCRDFSCKTPITDSDELQTMLSVGRMREFV